MSLTYHKNTDGAYIETYNRLPNLNIKKSRQLGNLALVEQNNSRPDSSKLTQFIHELNNPAKYMKNLNDEEDRKYSNRNRNSIQLPDIDYNDTSFVGNYIRAKHNLEKLPKMKGFDGKYFRDSNDDIQNGGKKRHSPKRSTKIIKRSTKRIKRSTKRLSKKRSTKRHSKKRSTKKRSTKKRSKKRSTKKHSTKKHLEKRSTKKRSKKRSTKKHSTKRIKRSTKKRLSKRRSKK